MIWTVAVLQCVLAVPPFIPSADWPAESVVIRGEEFEVWPAHELIRRGLDVQLLSKSSNAAPIYIDAMNKYDDPPDGMGPAVDYAVAHTWPTGEPDFAAYMDRSSTRQTLALAVKASRMDRCQFPYFGDSQGSILSVMLPNLTGYRHIGKMLIADGRRLEFEGDFQGALDRYATTMRMASHVSQGITLIETLVGLTLWTFGADSIADMAMRDDVPVTVLEAARSELRRLSDHMPGIERGIEMERTFATLIVDELCSKPFRLLSNLAVLTSGENGNGMYLVNVEPQADHPEAVLELWLGRLLLPDETVKHHIHDYFDAMFDHDETELDPFDSEGYISENVPRWDVVSRTVLPSLSRVVQLERRMRAVTMLAQTVVDVRLRLVQSGDDLSPRTSVASVISKSIKPDPFSKNGLVFRADEGRWIVYSVGPNLVDDGGTSGEKWDQFDIVYRYPPPPAPPFTRADDAR